MDFLYMIATSFRDIQAKRGKRIDTRKWLKKGGNRSLR